MSCNVEFKKGLHFDCIKEIINDVRNTNISVDTLKMGLWVLGGAADLLISAPQIFGDTLQEKTMEDLCDEIECRIPMFGSNSEEKEAELDPFLLIALTQLVFQVIQFFRKKN